MKFERAEAGWQPMGMKQVEQVELQPALLGLLFGPPGQPEAKYSSGNYRFRADDGAAVELYDWRLTREATGSQEQRPAAALWSSQECWKLEVGTSDSKVLPDFYRWLCSRIADAVRERVQGGVKEGHQLLAQGKIEDARKKLWEAEEWLPPDPRLEDPGLGSLLVALKTAIEKALAVGPLSHPQATFTFHYGQANAPDSRGGRDSLTMFLDGRLALSVQQGARTQKWTARTDPTLIARFRDILVEIGFPNIPMGILAPGVSSWDVVVQSGDQRLSAMFCTNPYRRQAPHRDLFAIGTGLCAKIRNDRNAGLSDTYGVMVEDVQSLP